MQTSSIAAQVPLAYPNRDGLRLFGMVHTPQRGRSDIAVVLLSPGVKMRVGPQALYRRITDALVDVGLTVFRFDYHGLGDSEGTLAEEQLRDVYNHIECGRYVADTIDTLDWIQQQYGIQRFVLGGLCGGAVTGVLAASRDPRVEGILALGMTPVLSANSADASRYMTEGQLKTSQSKYARRLLSPRAWWRLLTLQADTRLIYRMGRLWLRDMLGLPTRRASCPGGPEMDNANPHLPTAFFALLARRCPMLLVYGGSDRLRFEFEEKFLARHRERLASLPHTYEMHEIASANHVLTLRIWQDEMIDIATRWLRERFPADAEPLRAIGEPAQSSAGGSGR